MKSLAAAECGIRAQHIKLPSGATEAEIRDKVRSLNDDPSVDGVLVQLPLGDHIDTDAERRITEEIDPSKDVDGFHTINTANYPPRPAIQNLLLARLWECCACLSLSVCTISQDSSL